MGYFRDDTPLLGAESLDEKKAKKDLNTASGTNSISSPATPPVPGFSIS